MSNYGKLGTLNFYKNLKIGKRNNDYKSNIIFYKETGKRNNLKKGIFCVLDWSSEEIGEELIRVSKKLLNKIEKRELYRAIFLKKDKLITSPNVIENINYSNNLTTFIMEDIMSYDESKERAKIIDKWARIAQYCRSKKDYNDCFAINTAFNSYIITGLKRTQGKVNQKNIKSINEFCSINGNYKFAREEIKQLINKKEPFYPFLGMILRDFNFYEEKSKYLINGNLINFEKIENIQYIIDKNFRFKNEDNKKSQMYYEEFKFLEKIESITEDYLESLANEIEPNFTRNNGKRKYKKETKIDKYYFYGKNYDNLSDI